MGTTGAGKTTIGKLLAEQLGWVFLDADDFHPAANIEKMKKGIPLTDADRVPWLAAIHAELVRQSEAGKKCVLACSALKKTDRGTLGGGGGMKGGFLEGRYGKRKKNQFKRRGDLP